MRLQDINSDVNSLQCSPYIRQLCQELELTPNRRDTGVCYICFTARPDACFMECGHGGLCFDCASLIARKRPHACPFCRNRIAQVLRITGPPAVLRQGHTISLSEEAYELRQTSNRVGVNDDYSMTL